jgi:hypothetical protein
VREVAKRRVDAVESIFNEMRPFFRRSCGTSEEPTEKELLRDVKATLPGKRDGEAIIRNVKPKVIAGKREVIDKKFSEDDKFKETLEEKIKE